MNNAAIIGLLGTIMFVTLAYLVWRRGRVTHAAPSGGEQGSRQGRATASNSISRNNVSEETEALPREELPAVARASSGARTELLPRSGSIAAPRESSTQLIPRGGSTQATSEPATEYLSREEILAAAVRQEQPVDPATEQLSREEILSAPQRDDGHAPATEQLSREEILAIARGQVEVPVEPQLPRSRGFENAPQAVELGPVAATPAPAPTPKRSVDFGLNAEELGPPLLAATKAWRAARDARLDLDALAADPEAELENALAFLDSASERASREFLEAKLSDVDVDSDKRAVVAMSLLRCEPRRTLGRIADLVDQGIDLEALRAVLLRWRGRDADWHLLQHVRGQDTYRAYWLALLHERRVDPQAELLDALLDSDDPETQTWGLRLGKYHDDADRRRRAAAPHLTSMRHPQLRMAAVELAVFDHSPVAWLFCRQMATESKYPRAAELVAFLGNAQELAPLLQQPNNREGEGLWRVCRSGRKAAAKLAAARLQVDPDDEFAATGLCYVIGPSDEGEDGDALLSRWSTTEGRLEDKDRYLYGARFGVPEVVVRCLKGNDVRHRHALADELWFRSGGKLGLDADESNIRDIDWSIRPSSPLA